MDNNSNGGIPIVYQDAVYGSEQRMTRFGTGNAWDPRWSPIADVMVLVANASRNDALWLVHKGEWTAVQLTKNKWVMGRLEVILLNLP